MASGQQHLLSRAYIAASVSGKEAEQVKLLFSQLCTSNTCGLGCKVNALAYTLGETSKLPERLLHKVEDWLEWEETVLRPAIASNQPNALFSAEQQLVLALSGKSAFLGNELTVADIAIFSTLHPIANSGKLGAEILDYLSRIEKSEGVAEGLKNFEVHVQQEHQHRLQAGPSVLAKSPESEEEVTNVNGQDLPRNSASGDRPEILPIKGQRNILITSALPYVNNVPHLGNIVGCVLSADCYARFARSRGYNTLYVCGTDEYGTATETKALEEGVSCQEVCDRYHAIHKAVYEWFEISFDKFGRTPTWQQTEICQDIFKRLHEEGCIIEDTVEQLYSEGLGKFLADRFVLGTCPKCSFEDAKGDQCDNCGSMLNPVDLINPRCKITGTTPVLRTTRHLFLDLPKLSAELQEYVDTTSDLGGWSANCIATTKAWMRDGLKQRCITRDLIWGTPVPQEGYEDKVFYVWFDAPIGYISITANYTDQWKAWWQNPEEVEMVQFMGKDNVPFHTIIFPSTLIGTKDKWTKMKSISVTEYLNYEGTKFSKSNGTGVFGTDAKDTGIPVEVWRYYLLSNRPEVSDTDFKWSDLRSRLNSELLANLGNFINRALVFTSSKFEGIVPEADFSDAWITDAVEQLRKDIKELTQQYIAAMESIRIRDGISKAMAISSRANKFLQDTKPWDLRKGDAAQVKASGTVINVALGIVLLLAGLIEPFMPSVSEKILEQLRLPRSAANLTDSNLVKAASLAGFLPSGHKIGQPKVLFREMREENEIEALRQRYGGKQQSSSTGNATPNGVPGKGKAKAKAKQTSLAEASKGEKEAQSATQSVQGKSKPKEKKAKAPPQKAAVPTDISAVDLRVGILTNVRRHANADSLYVEDVLCGEAQPRQVVSGLVKHIPIEAMEGRRVVIVANLKAGNMRGVKSQAMVLAASSADGSKVELVTPPRDSAPGDKVTVAGFQGEPAAVLKKDAFDAIANGLKTDSSLVACFNGVALESSAGLCRVETLVDAAIH